MTSQVWTSSQQQAIHTTDRSVLVSASAGSGKTAVLAERCAHLVCDLPVGQRCDVDRLLVVTFTESAAGEMRSRIARSIRDRLAGRPTDAWLHRQLSLLDAADISTIHAFCLRLVRAWFAQANVDPNATVMDEEEAELLRRETIEALFARLYARGSDLARRFQGLVESYGDGRDAQIAELVLDLHAFTRSLVHPKAWLDRAREWVRPTVDGKIPQHLERTHHSLLRRELEWQIAGCQRCIDHIGEHLPSWMFYADRIAEYTEALTEWHNLLISKMSPDALEGTLHRVRSFEFPHARGVPRAAASDECGRLQKEESKELFERCRRDFVNRLRCRHALFTSEEIVDGLRRVVPAVETITDLVDGFDIAYGDAKREQASLDFSDLERLTIGLLAEQGDPDKPSDLARQVRRRFVHVLVDEFQDINPVQEAILKLVSRENDPSQANNLFSVGDIKQSIYRFRLAEPSIFLQRQAAFSGDGEQGVCIALRDSFRSRPAVLEAVNAIFERIMTPDLGGISYGASAELRAGLSWPQQLETACFDRPAVELHLLEKDASGSVADEADGDVAVGDAESILEWERIEREAYLVGRRICQMMGQEPACPGMRVFDRAADSPSRLEPRRLQYRDIAVLLRAPRHKATRFAAVLRRMNLPVYAELTAGYFASSEVQDVLSLLAVLDNQQQDIPLAAVLRSPILSDPLNESELVRIRHVGGGMPFYEAVVTYARRGKDRELRERLRSLVTRVQDYRGAVRCRPLADVLWRIYQETGYLAYVGGLVNGVQRRANLLKLHERARQFGAFRKQGLFRFLRFIEQLQEREQDLGPAAALSEAEDVIRVMSIHRSKGLEFPVVVVADLGKAFNLDDARGRLVVDRSHYIGPKVMDTERRIEYPCLAHQLASEQIVLDSLAEEMRILYVAITRARERVVLVGSTDLTRVQQERVAWRTCGGPLPALTLATARCPLDWLLPAIGAQPDGNVRWPGDEVDTGDGAPLFEVQVHDADAIRAWTTPDQQLRASNESLRTAALAGPLSADEPRACEDPAVASVFKRVRHVYPPASITAVPAVMAASEMKRRFDVLAEPDDRAGLVAGATTRGLKPRFVEPDGLTGGTVRGTATHLVLQHLDMTEPLDAGGIRTQIDAMVRAGLLAPPEGDVVDVEAIEWFFTTSLGRRLRRVGARIRREVMVVWRLPLAEYDPALRGIDERDVILIRGIIDAMLPGERAWEIVDYKSDEIPVEQVPARSQGYRRQLEIYARAAATIWRKPIERRWLVFLTPRRIVDV